MSGSLRHLPVVISRYTECGHATMSRRVLHVLFFLLVFFLVFIFYFFLPTTFTHTHTHDPRLPPTTHDPRQLVILFCDRSEKFDRTKARNISVFDSVEKKMKKTYWDKMTDCEDGGWCTSRAFVCSLHGANVSIPPHAYHLYLIYVKQAPPWLLVHRWVTPKRFNSFSWVRSILSCSRWYASDSA